MSQVDKMLVEYHKRLWVDYNFLTFPNFSSRYSWDIKDKKILVLLKSPGEVGSESVKECCITNLDRTSKNQRQVILKELRIPPSDILFWNFYSFHVPNNFPQDKVIPEDFDSPERWAEELENLVRIMENLRVIVLSGEGIWDGMRHFDPIRGISLVWTPSPAPQRFNVKELQKDYRERWKKVRQFDYDVRCGN